MQAEVPTGRRHWTQQQSTEDSAIPPLENDAIAMKDTVLDAIPANSETATHVPDTGDEPHRQGSPIAGSSGSLQSSPTTMRGRGDKLRGHHDNGIPGVGYDTPPPTPEDMRSQKATLPPEGVPYDEEIPPPLPVSDAPTSVDVVSAYEPLAVAASPTSHPEPHCPSLQSAEPEAPCTASIPQNVEQPAVTEEIDTPSLPHKVFQSTKPDVESGYDNYAYTHDVPSSETSIPEKKEAQHNGIAIPMESGCVDVALAGQENYSGASVSTKEELEGVAESGPVASAAACASPEPSAEPPLPGAVLEGAEEPRRGRRVSFSERPPLRAVYEAGAAPAAVAPAVAPAPLDPAARAVKEQGLGPGERWRILRNVTLISAAFMLLFTAFFGAANLQSSVNADQGLGTISLTAVYAAIIVSNLFLPSVVIRWLGCKWAVAGCMVLFAPYAAAQLWASWASLVPTALLLGAAGAPMWCAKCSYLNAAAGAYAAVTGAPRDLVMVRFFGLFYVLFPLGHVWGNLITSEVLSTGSESAVAAAANATLSVDVAAVCGANFCPSARSAGDNPNLARPPDEQIRTIGILFIALTLIAVLLVAVGVDHLHRYGEGLEEPAAGAGPEAWLPARAAGGGEGAAPRWGAGLLVATLRLLADRNQLLLVPVTAFIGISQAFLGADFTESYIACAWGIPYIGYVLMGYGLASSLASVAVSWAVKRVGRLPVVTASICLFLLLVAVLRWWTPKPGQGAAYVLLAAAWGLADSTALIINAMYGLLFRGREAAAYSNFSLWYSAGFIATYSYSPHLCAATKLAILAVILLLSLAGFITAELALRKILVAEGEAKKREEILAGAGISVLHDKAHAA